MIVRERWFENDIDDYDEEVTREKDYQPIKVWLNRPSFELTKLVKQDHHQLDEFLGQFRELKGKNRNEAMKLFLSFKAEAEKHIEWEEKIIFPMFEEHTGMYHTGPTQAMRTEHRMILEMLKGLADAILHSKTRTDELAETLIEKRLMELFKVHEQKEEEILYPWIDSALWQSEKEVAMAATEACHGV